MDKKQINELIQAGRDFMKSPDWNDLISSDQDLKKPQPPLYQEPKEGRERVALPRDFEQLDFEDTLFSLLKRRKSRRVYTDATISLLELSFLLWSAQGVKGRRGKSYATLRTVPSGGARHGFECYIDAIRVEGLKPGLYHYLAGSHELERIGDQSEEDRLLSVENQRWATRAGVIFYFTAVGYRFEWRYSIYAHRIALVDLGHVGENLYLAAEALQLGTCGIGAFSQNVCDRMLEVDGEDEFTVYVQPVGHVQASEVDEESIFYAFVEEEGL